MFFDKLNQIFDEIAQEKEKFESKRNQSVY